MGTIDKTTSDQTTRPLAQLLLRRLLLAYLVSSVVITGIQMSVEYREVQAEIVTSLESLATTFKPGAESALWEYQDLILKSLTNGIGSHPMVVAVDIITKNGEVKASWRSEKMLQISSNLVAKRALQRKHIDGHLEELGTLSIASSNEFVLSRLKESLFSVVLFNSVQMLFLGFLIWVFVKTLMVRPLVGFSAQVGALSLSGLIQPISLSRTEVTEIDTLQKGFNHLMLELAASHAQIAENNVNLKNHSQELEQRIIERTGALEAANSRLTAINSELEQRRLEAEENQRKLHQLSSAVVNSPATIVITDHRGIIEYVNPKFFKLTGYLPEEAIGKNPKILNAGLLPKELYEELWSTIIAGGEWRGDLCNKKKSGDIFWEHVSISPIRNDHGKITNFVAVKEDITEQRQITEKLRESESRFQRIVSTVPVMLYNYVIQPDGISRFLYVSPNCEDILELDYKELLLDINSFWKIVHSDDLERLLEEKKAANQAGQTFNTEVRIVTKSGIMKWMQLSSRPSFAQPGETPVWSGYLLDITTRKNADEERKRVAQALLESEATFKALADTSPLAIYVSSGLEQKAEYINPTFFRLFGYAFDEVATAALWWPLAYPDESYRQQIVEEWQYKVKKAIETNSEIEPIEVIVTCKDGSHKNIQWGFKAIGKNNWAFGLDLTERRQVEVALAKAKDIAESANRAKSTFLANMSHEIRTPMNAILGFAQVLERDPLLSQLQAGHVRTIIRGGNHLLSLINDILDISKIEAGQSTLNSSVFSLHDLVDDLELMFRSRTTGKDLQLIVDRDDTLPSHVLGDEGKLRQILVNLLGNAVKFTTSGGISVRLRADVETEKQVRSETDKLEARLFRLICEVEDSGPGIAEEDGPKIFSIFQQAKAGESAGGTGLGLSISRSLARMMGGDITYKSELGRGSCFRFEAQLELADPLLAPAQAESRRIVGLMPGTSPKRILITDDILENRLLLVTLLQPLGFEIMEATNGYEAIEIFEKWSPHLIFMDLRMPGMDGYEAIRQLKSTEKGRATPIIALTASAFGENEKHVRDIGVEAYLRKPFRAEELLFHLGKYLDMQYIFADEPSQKLQPEQILPSAILALPPELVEAMQQAVVEGDMSSLTELITQVENIDSNTAQKLQALADQYDYENLNRLLLPC